jgi:hypothetical protein
VNGFEVTAPVAFSGVVLGFLEGLFLGH